MRGGRTTDLTSSEEFANILNEKIKNRSGGSNQRLAQMLGMFTNDKENPIKANIPSGKKSNYSQEKYKFLLDAPFDVSSKCCNVMKKAPAHTYYKQTKRCPITAQMADESRLRTQKWLQNGCNGFDLKIPTSNPMSFWTENDVLQYIVENNLEICSVYGDVVPELEQMTLADYGFDLDGACQTKYKTTGCSRTGCVLCGFGCHLEKSPTRFELLHESHPGFYNLLDHIQNNGITYRQAIEWINENSDVFIKI